MDKKNTIIGLGLLAVAFLLSFWQGQQEAAVVKEIQVTQSEATSLEQSVEAVSAQKPGLFQKVKAFTESVTTSEPKAAATYVLENEKVIVTFSTWGGAVQSVALKAYPAIQGEGAPLVFNKESKDGIFELSLRNNNALQPMGQDYALVNFSPEKGRILFRHLTPEGVEILRGYDVSRAGEDTDPYLILHETKIINHSSEPLALQTLYLNVGTAPAVDGDQTGEFLNFGYYNGKDAEFVSVSEFQDRSGVFGIGKHKAVPFVAETQPKIEWGAVKNQFFTSVMTPDVPAQGFFVTSPVLAGQAKEEAIQGSLAFDFPTLSAGEAHTLGARCYVGPKEYVRLEALGNHQDLVMQFGFFGFISKLLLVLLTSIHNLVPNYGLTIIFLTIIVKLVLWPLTAASVRSSRRMAALQEPMKALKEKFKDNPQRLQQETMKLFKEYRVNPAAGCLPILVQIPIFLGLFWMLRSASELRFAHFLWVPDLSLPDTIFSFHGFPINILPLIMGLTMILQMKFSPTPSADPIQKKMFQLMPFLFLIICYNFPAGLVLYWTVQNCLTLLQQWWMRREPLPALVIEPGKKARKKKFA